PFPVDHSVKLDSVAPSLRFHYRTFTTTTRNSAPAPRVGTRALMGLPLEPLPSHRGAGSHVPHKSLYRIHAAYPAGRHLGSKQVTPRLFPDQRLPLVLTSSIRFRTVHQRFACARLPGTHLTESRPAFSGLAHHLNHWAKAAAGGLDPDPVIRVR